MSLRLSSVSFKNFRSIENTKLLVQPDITALVGENETGKTNLLSAIGKFTLDQNFHPLLDKKQHSLDDPGLIMEFEILDQSEELFNVLGAVGSSRTSKTLIIEKTGTKYTIKKPQINADKSSLLPAKIQKIKAEREKENQQREGKVPPNPSAGPGPDPNYVPPALLPLDPEDIRTSINYSEIEQEIIKWVVKQVPKIEYFIGFGTTPLIPGEIKIADLLREPQKFVSVVNLLSLAGITPNDLPQDAAKEIHRIKKASTQISQKISSVWEQEDITIELQMVPSPPRLTIRVKDGKMEGDIWLSPEQRSHGFQWYLAFFAHFLAELQNQVTNSILLLDDPGVFLHADGQADLLVLLQKIAENGNQIIYSTHSPFMIDRDYIERVRYLEKAADGTRVDNSAWSRGGHGVLPNPLRATLGMLLSDSLLYGKSNLLVEGPSDKIYLREFNSLVSDQSPTEALDLSKVSILPGYSAPGVLTHISFLLNENLNCAALLDSDTEGERAAEQLRNKYKLAEEKIVEIKSVKPGSKRQSSEDLIPKGMFIDAVNEVYSKLYENFEPVDVPSPYYPIVPILEEILSKRLGVKKDLEKVKVAQLVMEKMKELKLFDNNNNLNEDLEPLHVVLRSVRQGLLVSKS